MLSGLYKLLHPCCFSWVTFHHILFGCLHFNHWTLPPTWGRSQSPLPQCHLRSGRDLNTYTFSSWGLPFFLPLLLTLWLNYQPGSVATAQLFSSSSSLFLTVLSTFLQLSIRFASLLLCRTLRSQRLSMLHPTIFRVSPVSAIQDRWEILFCQMTNNSKRETIFYPSGQLNTW